MDRLTRLFEQHSGVQDPRTNAKELLVSFFVDGLLPQLPAAVSNNVIAWESKTPFEIVGIANYYNKTLKQKKVEKADKKEKLMALKVETAEKEEKLMDLQLHAYENPRPLPANPRFTSPTFPAAFSPPQQTFYCVHCGQPGHFRSHCPHLSSPPSYTSSAAEPPRGSSLGDPYSSHSSTFIPTYSLALSSPPSLSRCSFPSLPMTISFTLISSYSP